MTTKAEDLLLPTASTVRIASLLEQQNEQLRAELDEMKRQLGSPQPCSRCRRETTSLYHDGSARGLLCILCLGDDYERLADIAGLHERVAALEAAGASRDVHIKSVERACDALETESNRPASAAAVPIATAARIAELEKALALANAKHDADACSLLRTNIAICARRKRRSPGTPRPRCQIAGAAHHADFKFLLHDGPRSDMRHKMASHQAEKCIGKTMVASLPDIEKQAQHFAARIFAATTSDASGARPLNAVDRLRERGAKAMQENAALRAQLLAKDEGMREIAKSLHAISANPDDVPLVLNLANAALATIHHAFNKVREVAANISGKNDVDLTQARETIARLNRRCQLAESAAREKVKEHGGGSLGRALANFAAADYRAAAEELRAKLKQLAESIADHGCVYLADGRTFDLGPTRTLIDETAWIERLNAVPPVVSLHAVPIFCPACGTRHIDEGAWAAAPRTLHTCSKPGCATTSSWSRRVHRSRRR